MPGCSVSFKRSDNCLRHVRLRHGSLPALQEYVRAVRPSKRRSQCRFCGVMQSNRTDHESRFCHGPDGKGVKFLTPALRPTDPSTGKDSVSTAPSGSFCDFFTGWLRGTSTRYLAENTVRSYVRSSKALFACFEQALDIQNLDYRLLRLSVDSEGDTVLLPGLEMWMGASARTPSQITNMAKAYIKVSESLRSVINSYYVA